MMNIEKLIERLWNYSVHNNALSNLRTIRDAADALSTLQAENRSCGYVILSWRQHIAWKIVRTNVTAWN